GSVGGLTNGKTYYVVANPATDNQFGLAASLADATALKPVTLTLGAVTGSPALVGVSRTANTLDYSAYTTPLTVNLTTGTATGTGGVSDIQQVILGTGNATLTGGVAPDTFRFNP